MSANHGVLRFLAALTAMVLPQRPKRFVYSRVFKWDIDPSAVIGCSLVLAPLVKMNAGARIGHGNIVLGAGTVDLGSHSTIGFLNVINGCESVVLGRNASVGMCNWISGPPTSTGLYPHSPDRRPIFELGQSSTVVRGHRIECSDAVIIGAYTCVGGIRTQILTHGINVWTNTQQTQPVRIGDHCYLGTTVIVQAGTEIPPRSVVAPGAVVHGSPGQPDQLLGGVPARHLKSLAGAKYFTRKEGYVD
jgi:acetyltransferase-like isoleucine patch superfamily enzyme